MNHQDRIIARRRAATYRMMRRIAEFKIRLFDLPDDTPEEYIRKSTARITNTIQARRQK